MSDIINLSLFRVHLPFSLVIQTSPLKFLIHPFLHLWDDLREYKACNRIQSAFHYKQRIVSGFREIQIPPEQGSAGI